MKRRLLAMVLTVVMLLSAMPTAVFAAEAECEHDYSVETVIRPATCTESGVKKLTCSKCGVSKYQAVMPAHAFQEVSRKDATCGEDGKVEYACTACKETKTEILKATGKHTPAGKKKTFAATCTEGAKEAADWCTVCKKPIGEVKPVEGSKPLGHDKVTNTADEKYKPATCDEPGVNPWKCSRCGVEGTEPIPVLGHKWDDGKVVPADCEHGAGALYTCTVEGCGATKLDVFEGALAEPAKGHNYVAMPEIKPTCKDPGQTGGEQCAVCGAINKDNKPTEVKPDPNAHVEVLDKALKEPTCTETGIGKFKCSICGVALGYKVTDAAHKWAVVSRTESTCEKAGEEKSECTVCKTTKTAVLPLAEHTPTGKEKTFAATCTEPDKIAKDYCTVCEKPIGDVVVVEGSKPLGHDPKLDTTLEGYKAATCTEGGVDTFKCSRCGELTKEETKARGHQWDEGKHVEPDCEHGSGARYTCIACNETSFEPYPEGVGEAANGHNYAAMPEIKPTCKTPGRTGGEQCTVCGKINENNKPTEVEPDPNAHAEELEKSLKDPTCTATGIGKFKCSICGASLGYKVTDAAHEWVEESRTDSTCVKAGEVNYKCSDCHETKKEALPLAKHTLTTDENDKLIPADCTNPDRMAKDYCTVCEKPIGDVVVVEGSKPLGHDLELDETLEGYKAATCKEGGVDTFKCSRCDYTEKKDTKPLEHEWDDGVAVDAGCDHTSGVMLTCKKGCGETKVEPITGVPVEPALGHIETPMDDIPASCLTKGTKGGTWCPRCGKTLKEPEETPVNPENHEYVQDTVLREPTCYKPGIEKVTCACGKAATTYRSIETLAHTFDEANAKITKAPTCTDKGTMTMTCTVKECGAVVEVELEALGHDWSEEKPDEAGTTIYKECNRCGEIEIIQVLDPDVCKHEKTREEIVTEATCTEAGVKKVICEFCGKVLEENAEIPATGHTEEVIPAKEASCTETGLTEGKKCTVCGVVTVEQEEIPAHKAEVVPGTDATCTETGLTEGSKCSVCGETITAQVDIPALGHTEEVIPGKAATCTEAGLTEGKKCSVCGVTLAEQTAIAALGHTEEAVPGKAATCTEAGLTEGKKCSVCGVTLAEQTAIAALGHTEEAVPGKAATCTEAGLTEGKKCSVCGVTLAEQTAIPALGHTEEVIPGKPATSTESGLTEGKKCSVCGTIIVAQQEIPPIACTHNFVYDSCYRDENGKSQIVYKCSLCGAVK